jgi:hypothetical protein
MKDWFLIDGGRHWISCQLVSNVFGVATVKLYTGETKTGTARKGLFGWLVDGKVTK